MVDGSMRRGCVRMLHALLAVLVGVATVGAMLEDDGDGGPIPEQERAALVSLYNATNGDAWRVSWNLEQDDPCGPVPWYGVQCESGHVWSIALQRNNLTGVIPTDIGELSHLYYVYLGENALSGTIPSEVGQLKMLRTIALDSNELSGEIPLEVAKLSRVSRLHLEHNEFGGDIDWIVEMQSITYADISYNRFEGVVPPALVTMAIFEQMHFENNRLFGTLPPLLGAYSFNLHAVFMQRNNLSGAIPTALCDIFYCNLLGNGNFTCPLPKAECCGLSSCID